MVNDKIKEKKIKNVIIRTFVAPKRPYMSEYPKKEYLDTPIFFIFFYELINLEKIILRIVEGNKISS